MTQMLAFSTSMRFVFQRLAFFLVVVLSVGLVGYTAACAFGLAPWLELSLTFGTTVYPDAGPLVQGLITALAVAMAFFLPTNARVMALETSHRSFAIGMRDVTRAYAVAHARDRETLFDLSSEFDSIRARMAFLRDHPDLAELEPSALEVAAQMSHVSAELARIYSDDAVARATNFLIQRQIEMDEFNTRLNAAKAAATEVRQWAHRLELDEDVAESQLARLREELGEILPELLVDAPQSTSDTEAEAIVAPQPDMEFPHSDERIVALQSKRAAE